MGQTFLSSNLFDASKRGHRPTQQTPGAAALCGSIALIDALGGCRKVVDGLFSRSEDLHGPNIPEQQFVRRFEEEPSSNTTNTSRSCTLWQLSLINALGGCRKLVDGLFSRSEDLLRGPNIPEQQFV